MKPIIFVSALVLACLNVSLASDLTLGTTYNGRLVWTQKTEYYAYPLLKRVKDVFYNDVGQQVIKGIVARDLDGSASGASASVTAGGVGATYVNLRFKSERGGGLNYQIEIYV